MSELKHPCVSERIEPAVTHILGALGMTVVDAVKAQRANPDPLAWCVVRNSVSQLRYAMRALKNLSACTPGATHFHIAISNETRRVETWLAEISEEFGLPAERA